MKHLWSYAGKLFQNPDMSHFSSFAAKMSRDNNISIERLYLCLQLYFQPFVHLINQ